MEQQNLFDPIAIEKLDLLTREELILFYKLEQQMRIKFQKEVDRLRALSDELKQKCFMIDGQYIVLKNKLFGKSSERESSEKDKKKEGKKNPLEQKKKKVQLPSERYPEAQVIERRIEFKKLPPCPCCGETMKDSGMTEDSEYLTVIPAQFCVVVQKRQKCRCGKCHGAITTAPVPPRIKPGSTYSDEMIVDVALSKYCDLIPIERYSAIAGREGLKDLPPQSLIECTHNLADFLKPATKKLKDEVLADRYMNADETPHRMLEGDDKTNWYLWGFSTKRAAFFEARDTRSGEVASELLINSKCEYLMSDVYSGYSKAIKDANEVRKKQNLPLIKGLNCNAHARRKFKEAKLNHVNDAQFFIDQYREIYILSAQEKGRPPDEVLGLRSQMKPYFEQMKKKAEEKIVCYSSKSSMCVAMSYFLNNYDRFVLFLEDPELPIDNNPQERLLRNPVIGRKTWYGTHSKRGAETSATLFSLVESCKLNKVNPREYFKNLVQDLHQGKEPLTPYEYKCLSDNQPKTTD